MATDFRATAGGTGEVLADVLVVGGVDVIKEIDSITGVEGGKVNRTGDTMTGALVLQSGLSFGSNAVLTPQDLSKQIDLWGGTYGVSITDSTVNLVTATAGSAVKFAFYEGTSQVAIIQNAVTATNCLTTKSYVDGQVANAANVTTGTFAVARIPALDASKITTGSFAAAQIPDLDAAKIATGTLATARIPTLPQSQITDLTTDLAAKLTATAAQFTAKLTASQGAAQANSTAADVAGLVTDFNALLAKLRTAGIIAT